MHLRFDPTFDHGAWPDALSNEPAVAGRAAVGPAGLLNVLETIFGLGGVWAPDVERAASLIPVLLGSDGFWSRSASADPLGTARRVLRLRDDLWLEGWSGERLSVRLDRLAAVTASVPAGLADRVAAVATALSAPGAERAAEAIARLEVVEPSDDLPGRWRQVLERLAQAGVDVVSAEPAPAWTALQADHPAASDLGMAKAAMPDWTPIGDATLQIVRSTGLYEAAETTAAWLAAVMATGGLEGVVLVGNDAVLDAALARYGVPTGGVRPDAAETPLAGALPLALQLAWGPPEPAHVRELLLLPSGPIPRPVAAGLVHALDEWPAVGSPEWEAALTRSLEGWTDANAVHHRVDTLLRATVPHGELCAQDAMDERLGALASWSRAGLDSAVAAGEPTACWRLVVRQLEIFRRLAASAIPGAAEPSAWHRLASAATDAAVGETKPEPRHPAQAGLARVGDPGGITGPARAIVWWDFCEDAEHGSPEPPVSTAERRELAAAGVQVPDFARRAMSRAARYRRPLLFATECLLLVSPRLTATGEEAHPHPLWDEITSRLDAAALEPLVRTLPTLWPAQGQAPGLAGAGPQPVRRTARLLVEAPSAQREWRIPASTIGLRLRESPSSLEKLIGCSLNWVLEYLAKAKPGLAAGSYGPLMLRGKVAHAAVAEALTSGVPPSAAAAVAEAYFERMGPVLAAGLFVPGAEADRASLKHLVGAAAHDLAITLQESGYTEVSAERWFEGEGPGTTLGGRADLVLGPRRAVIDMKLGGARRLRQALEAGTAMQLAAYAALVDTTEPPPVGYYVLGDRRMLTTSPGAFRGSTAVTGPSMEETWSAAGRAVAERVAQLADGSVEAGGVGVEDQVPSKSSLQDGLLVVTPPCRFCEYAALCGRSYGLLVSE